MNRRLIILLALAALLAIGYFLPEDSPAPQVTAPVQPAAPATAATGQLPEQDYSVLFARPLFDPSRRIAQTENAGPEPTSFEGWKLLGTYAGIGALLSDAGGQTKYLRLGDSWNGVNLVSAGADSVELDAGSGPERLSLPRPDPIVVPVP